MAAQLNKQIATDIALKYMEAVKAKYSIGSFYLFGSMVNGIADDDSDIDIAVVSHEFTGDIVQDTYELLKLRRGIDTRIEPHPILQEDFIPSNPFAREIMSTGITLL